MSDVDALGHCIRCGRRVETTSGCDCSKELGPCVGCHQPVPEYQLPPYPGHAPNCPLVAEWMKTLLLRSKEEITRELEDVEKDERLHYPAADARINIPLALVQTALSTKANTLRWALRLPAKYYHGEKEDKEEEG